MSTIDNAKKAAAWQHPNERRGCQDCHHGYQEAAGVGFCAPSWRCREHGFYTNRYAICDKWAARKARVA